MKLKNTMLINSLLFFTLSSQALATEENNNSTRFALISFEKQTILQDFDSKLEWVNGKQENNATTNEANLTVDDGCTNFDSNPKDSQPTVKQEAQKYCEMLTFASYKDWRVPTDIEHQDLITATHDENVSLYYHDINCTYGLGINEDKINMIATHNSPLIGKITLWNEQNSTSCLRCVRDAEAPLTP